MAYERTDAATSADQDKESYQQQAAPHSGRFFWDSGAVAASSTATAPRHAAPPAPLDAAVGIGADASNARHYREHVAPSAKAYSAVPPSPPPPAPSEEPFIHEHHRRQSNHTTSSKQSQRSHLVDMPPSSPQPQLPRPQRAAAVSSAPSDAACQDSPQSSGSSAFTLGRRGSRMVPSQGYGSDLHHVGNSENSMPESDMQALSAVPGNVDVASYLLGQRTALERALRECMPQREVLGALKANVTDMKTMSQEDASRLRRLESAGAALREALSNAAERIVDMEQRRLPMLEDALAELRGAMNTATGLREEITLLRTDFNDARAAAPPTAKGMLMSVFNWLLARVAKLDIAAVFLARRILLDAESLAASEAALQLTDTGQAKEQLQLLRRRIMAARLRAIAGAILTLCAVEASWRIQQAVAHRLPKIARTLQSPLEVGIRWVRLSIWAAAFAVSIFSMKHYCFYAADAISRLPGFVTTKSLSFRRTDSGAGSAYHPAQDQRSSTQDEEAANLPPSD
eukprot:jgi/Chlat1/292/Chrsp1S03171